MSWQGAFAALRRRIELNLDPKAVALTCEKNGAESWHSYACEHRRERMHVWWPSLWLAVRLSRNARILETGCGCGLNLIWFGEQGFSHLYGVDIDKNAIATAKELAGLKNLNLELKVDNSLAPISSPPCLFDALLALNWTYHVEEFDLGTFLGFYRNWLTPKGYLALDVIDEKYCRVPDNQYLTSDWDKRLKNRRPTEYKHRFSLAAVERFARINGYKIVASRACNKNQVVPRIALILKNGK